MLIEDMGQYLHDRGLGVLDLVGSTGTIFLSTQPASPDDCISLYDTGGTPSLLPNDHQRRVQIIVRAVNYADAGVKSWAIFRALKIATVIGGNPVIVRPVDVPRHIGQDNNKRHEFTINLEMWAHGD